VCIDTHILKFIKQYRPPRPRKALNTHRVRENDICELVSSDLIRFISSQCLLASCCNLREIKPQDQVVQFQMCSVRSLRACMCACVRAPITLGQSLSRWGCKRTFRRAFLCTCCCQLLQWFSYNISYVCLSSS
jgi:hypothetical protein